VKRMPRRGHLLTALAHSGFRRLLATRLLGQFGDGVFQASLAGAVLFNPEKQARAADVAAAFAVLLLPYSMIGPFAGVLLDRWRRRNVLIFANVFRAVGLVIVAAEILGRVTGPAFYATALVVVSLNRFFLSALSASLPHVVGAQDLVTANALSTTSGAIVTTAGAGAAIGVRALSSGTDRAYAAVALAAIVPYLLAAIAARAFGADTLGPDDVERGARESLREVARGLVAGARHVYARPRVLYALTAITAQKMFYGISVICTVLLYRNYFHDEGVFRAGLGGLGQVVVAVALGGGIAALITPVATRHLGYVRWPAALLAASCLIELALGLPFTMPALLLAALLLGVASQGIKICVDTVVQQDVADDFRGRVFALYDTTFNLTLVLAAVITAVSLPADGHSVVAVVVIGAGYAVTAIGYLHFAGSTAGPTPGSTAPGTSSGAPRRRVRVPADPAPSAARAGVDTPCRSAGREPDRESP
jgi:hypothetical protein